MLNPLNQVFNLKSPTSNNDKKLLKNNSVTKRRRL